MKKFLAAMVLVVGSLLLMSTTQAAVKIFDGVGEHIMSDFESSEIAKLRARDIAVKNAVKQAGVYLKTFSRSINFELSDDEIAAIASNAWQLVGEPKYTRTLKQVGDKPVILLRATVEVEIDDTEIQSWLKRDDKEKSAITQQNKDLQKMIDAQYKQIAELKQRIAKVDNKPVEKEKPAPSKPKTDEADIAALTKQNGELLKQIDESNKKIDELKKELAEKERLAKKIADENNPALKQEVGGQIFEGVGEYRMGSSDTIIYVEKGARILAMQNALERAGILVSSYAQVKDFELDKDVITTKSHAVLKVIEAKPEWKDFVCRMTVKVDINVAELNKWLEQESKKSK